MPRRGASTAVVVDHWPLVRLGITRVLSSNDVRVVGEAGHPLEGIQLARTNVVDLVLLGEFEGDRLEAVRQFYGLPQPPKIGVFIGQASRDELAALLRPGAY